MNSSALITFLIIATFVWGGVALIVWTAFRKESAKAGRATDSVAPSRSTES